MFFAVFSFKWVRYSNRKTCHPVTRNGLYFECKTSVRSETVDWGSYDPDPLNTSLISAENWIGGMVHKTITPKIFP